MTPTTKAKPADAVAELERLETAAQAARQERDRLKRDAQAFVAGLEALDAELGRLARTEPGQFGPDGTPKPKSRAAELQAELKRAAESARWRDLIAGAEHVVGEAERALAQHRADNAVELATAEYRRGEELLAKLGPHADQILGALAELDGVTARLMAIAASCGGRLDGRDVADDSRLRQLAQLLVEHPSFASPRSRTLTPFPDENPPIVRAREGGWILASHGSDSIADEQPPRIEAAR